MADFNPRKTAVDILYKNLKNEDFLKNEIESLRKKNVCSALDIRFLSEICYGVVRNSIYIDSIIKDNSTVKLNRISPYILCVLRSGIYQLYFMEKVPPSAAVNESVKIVKKSSMSRLCGYVNAVLRSAHRNYVPFSEVREDSIEALSVKYSYPLWLLKRWESFYGFNFVKSLVRSFKEKANVYARSNTLKTTPEDLLKMLKGAGVEAEIADFNFTNDLNIMLKINSAKDIWELDEFKKGLFYIQDPASAFVPLVASPKSGETVIDMCSAPGGKATFMAQLMENKGKILAFDLYENKVEKIKENARNLGVDIIEASTGDATVCNEKLKNFADIVLCDVPCTGLGTLKRKPDVKFLRSEQDIYSLKEVSEKILHNASMYVKEGGTLVFSTCTIDKDENLGALEDFLSKHKNFQLEKITCTTLQNNGYISFYPHIHNTDGFFVAKMIKTENL